MIIKFTETKVARNVLNKGVTFEKLVNVRLRGAVDPINPVVVLRGMEFANSYNYASMTLDRERFYFIQDIENAGGDLFKITFELDAIETYREDILLSNSRFRRNLKTGDYFPSNVEEGVLKTITKHDSNVTMTDGTTMILSTVGN